MILTRIGPIVSNAVGFEPDGQFRSSRRKIFIVHVDYYIHGT